MEIIINEGVVPEDYRSEFCSILRRIIVGKNKQLGEAIHVIRRLQGGLSGCGVYEGKYGHGKMIVIKVGEWPELKREYESYKTYVETKDPSNYFVPIRNRTSGLYRKRQSSDDKEAVIYQHAADYDGSNACKTFEEAAAEAIVKDESKLGAVIKTVTEFFQGIENDFYKHCKQDSKGSLIINTWNLRFGPDYVIEVDNFIKKTRRLEKKDPLLPVRRLHPLDMFKNTLQTNGAIKPGMYIEIRDFVFTWWNERLVGENINEEGNYGEPVRVEIVTDSNTGISIRELARDIKKASRLIVAGKVLAVRTQRQQLLVLTELKLTANNDSMTDTDLNETLDPFVFLPRMEGRKQKLTSIVHGDLNPRNILVVDHGKEYMRSYLIDYAYTNKGQPFFFDFVRLEICLARNVLPTDLTWAQHIMLQRYLSAASRLGGTSEQLFVGLLGDQQQLISAFRLLFAIRNEAFRIYCNALNIFGETYRQQWFIEFTEQLFLHAHLAFKWEQARPEEKKLPRWHAALRATTAIAGVAAESLSAKDLYRKWNKADLTFAGLRILEHISSQPEQSSINLMDLAGMAYAIEQLDLKRDNPLEVAFEKVRVALVKQSFRNPADALISQLGEKHNIYISLTYMDLKGSFSPAQQQQHNSIEEMLENDRLLAASEQLRSVKGDESVLDLILRHPAITLIGDAGSGKSTVCNELRYRLALSILGKENLRHPNEQKCEPRLPVLLEAAKIADILERSVVANKRLPVGAVIEQLCKDLHGMPVQRLLAVGALYIIVDALNELPGEKKRPVVDWITALKRNHRRTHVIVCHREYNYTPGLLSFPIVTLQKVNEKLARSYIENYFFSHGTPDPIKLADKLWGLLFDPLHEKVRDLARTPLFLWMIVSGYHKNGILPTSRGRLFRDFCQRFLEGNYNTELKESSSFNEKARLLGILGYTLVQQRSTLLTGDIKPLLPSGPSRYWQKVLGEIMETKMLEVEAAGIRFLHQSFQEYFAARHFIEHEAANDALIEEKVRKLDWHDTFIVLIGFADESPDVVKRVIEVALRYNPLLTARCLRMAEAPDKELLHRFVQAQIGILQNPDAGSFSYERAARVLTDYGRDEALYVLFETAADKNAPEDARIQILNELVKMPDNELFKATKDKIIAGVIDVLVKIFDQEAPARLQVTAIQTMVKAGRGNNEFKNLKPYLNILLDNPEWEIKKEAWKAYTELQLGIEANRRDVYKRACLAQLNETKQRLYMEPVTRQMDEYNRERIMIFKQIATIENLPLLLDHRFSIGVQTGVSGIIDDIVRSEHALSNASNAFMILQSPVTDVDRLLLFIKDGDDAEAAAAGHKLEKLDEKLSAKKLSAVLSPALPLQRLQILAHLISVSNNRTLAKRLEHLLRKYIKIAHDERTREAFSGAVLSLINLDNSLGIRFGMIADSIFWTENFSAHAGHFPWTKVFDRLHPEVEHYQALLNEGGDDAHAAVHWLFSKAAIYLVTAEAIPATTLNAKSLQRFRYHVKHEKSIVWLHYFVGAAVRVHDATLLLWLVAFTRNPQLVSYQISYSHYNFGEFNECYLATVFRAIGYLSQALVKDNKCAEAASAVAHLRENVSAIRPDTPRSVIIGLTTAIGYLGEWEPILFHLNPEDPCEEEPWMYIAAENIFKYWIPKTKEGMLERDRAARWIGNYLREGHVLQPHVRSAFERIKDRLETELGYNV